MLLSAETICKFGIHATDGEIGKVRDVYFDDATWTIRYFVVQTGHWLAARQVLISPAGVTSVNGATRTLDVSLSRQQVQDSPDIDTDKPVSRQHEAQLVNYYGWPIYWETPYTDGRTPEPIPMGDKLLEDEAQVEATKHWSPHLRSLSEVRGYFIHAEDGDIGHVDDMLVADKGWIIRYVVVDTRNWLPGRRVLISPLWIKDVSWAQRHVSVDLLRHTIREAPQYNPDEPVTRQYEERLFAYYGRPEYWMPEPELVANGT